MVYNENYETTKEKAMKLVQAFNELIASTPQTQPEVPHFEEDILTPKEAAQYLKVCEATIRNNIKRGTIPHFHVNGRVRFKKSGLNEWIEAQQRKGA